LITHKAGILILIACCLQGPAGPLAARAGAQDQAAAPPYLCGSPSFAGQAEALMRILATPGLDMEQSSIVILNGDSPDPVFAYHADLPLLPASVMKVFTSAAALHYLKPEYVFTTVLAADGAPAQGVIQGNVYLQASADPYFTPEQMHAFAARVAHEGIRALRGTLIVDTTIQETEPFPSTWEADDIGQTYAPPIFPLSYAFNAFSVRINGSNAAGGKPDIWIMPDLPLFHVVNNAAVATQGRTELSIQVIDPAPDGRIEVMVDGRIRAGETFQDYRTVQRPAEYFLAAVFDELR
jgi:D-alanyl-D-alanine carboxypeptidase/D-alanyl-D-alanine-endopeptidase (penicillin-binding protein 4)